VSSIEEKLITLDEAVALSASSSTRVGLTNGCFDIFHGGHCDLLEFSRENCDILLVGLNTDSIIKRRKGKDRPINCLYERMKVVASNKDVDFVFSFDFENALHIVEKIVPDAYFQGDEYRGLLSAEEEITNVMYIEKNKSSSSNTIDRILSGYEKENK
jgi:rfaE bifunctional protein nucleotidyltransferase chain/domain